MFGSGDKVRGMCEHCKKAKATDVYDGKRYCEPCAMSVSKELYKLAIAGGGKVVDGEAPPIIGQDAILLPFDGHAQPEKPDVPQITGSDLIFHYGDGQRRMVRISEEEQRHLIDIVVTNRRLGKKDFQFMPVAVIPMDAMVSIHNIIEAVAKGEQQQELAVKFLESMKHE
jgi:hypothetical protein